MILILEFKIVVGNSPYCPKETSPQCGGKLYFLLFIFDIITFTLF